MASLQQSKAFRRGLVAAGLYMLLLVLLYVREKWSPKLDRVAAIVQSVLEA